MRLRHPASTSVPYNVTGGAGVEFATELRQPGPTSYLGRWDGHTYAPAATTTLNPATIGVAGGSQPHNNIQPVTVLNYCIALYGIYPSHS